MASMSGAPRVRSLNVAVAVAEPEPEARPVLVPGGNKDRSVPATARKPVSKPIQKAALASVAAPAPPPDMPAVAGAEKEVQKNSGSGATAAKGSSPVPSPRSTSLLAQPPRKHDVPVPPRSLKLPLNVSCSSDTSIESFRNRSSTGRIGGVARLGSWNKAGGLKQGKVVNKGVSDGAVAAPTKFVQRRRCAWVTPTTDPCYVTFHDEEWGAPAHDDKRLFELLGLSSALSELAWPEILKKRHIYREIFMDFDPAAVSKMNEKKLVALNSIASSLLSEQKLRAIVENARQILKIVDEFGSFDQYCWRFLNQKPIVSKFRYPSQVPIKSPKADMISKDLLRRGFRSVSPVVVYSFMQAAGLTNDHLVCCFRFEECNAAAIVCANETDRMDAKGDLKTDGQSAKISSKDIASDATLSRAIDTLIIS